MICRQLSKTPSGVWLGDGQALAALAAASVNDGAAPTSSHAGAEANLAEALFAVWSESRLHRCEVLKGSAEVPDQPAPVKAPLGLGAVICLSSTSDSTPLSQSPLRPPRL